MDTAYVPDHPARRVQIWHRFLVVFIVLTQLSVIFSAKPAHAVSLTSLLGVDDLAHKTLNQIDQVINNTQGALHDQLTALHSQVSDIINQLESTYKDMLNVTLDSLDVTIQQVATTLANQLDDINTKINQDITNAQQQLIGLIQDARNQIGTTLSQFEDSANQIVVLITQSTVFILDRAAWNAIGVGAVLILLIGLLIIPVAVILEKGWPQGAGGIITAVLVVAFVVVGGLLAFVPSAKAQALKAVGKGTEAPTIAAKPQIFSVIPNPVILGQTTEIKIDGVHLMPDGNQPVVTIRGVTAAIHGAGDNEITVAAPTSGSSGTVQLTLTYGTGQPSIGVPLGLIAPTATPTPATIRLDGFSVLPVPIIAGQTSAYAKVMVKNTGGTASQQFDIVWSPMPNVSLVIHIPALNPGASLPFTSGLYPYLTAGTFQTQIHSGSTQMGNNPSVLSNQINVYAPPPTATPTVGPPITISSGLVDVSGQFGATCDMRHDFEVDMSIPPGYQWDGDAAGVRNSITVSGTRNGASTSAVGDASVNPVVNGQTLALTVHVGIGSQFPPCGTLYIAASGKAVPK